VEDFGIGDEVMVKLFRYLLLSVVASKTLEKAIKERNTSFSESIPSGAQYVTLHNKF
jgi:hypothetical protein